MTKPKSSVRLVVEEDDDKAFCACAFDERFLPGYTQEQKDVIRAVVSLGLWDCYATMGKKLREKERDA